VEPHQKAYWQVCKLLSSVPRFSIFHCFTVHVERGTRDRESTRLVNKHLSDLWKIPTPDGDKTSGPFKPDELSNALNHLEPEKSLGLNSIFPEFIPHAVSALTSWLCGFLTSCIRQLKILRICRRALAVAIPKPNKPLRSQRVIALCLYCVSFKILCVRVECDPIHRSIPPTETGGLSTREVDRRLGHFANARHQAGAVFVDLTAAYDTVWHRGLTCKLLRFLLDRHIVRVIMEMVGNRSFTLTTGNNKRSRLRHLKNGFPQGSVLAPLLFNIYTSDLPIILSRKYVNTNDLAIMHAYGGWQAVEGVPSKDMATIGKYLQTW